MDDQGLLVFPYDPGGHGTLVLYHGRLQGVVQLSTQFFSELEQKRFINQVTLGSVGQLEAASGDALDLVLDSNRGGETAKEEASRFQNPPCTVQHGPEVIVAGGKVEHGATDHNIGDGVWEGHCFDTFQSEIVRREFWRDRCGEATSCLESARIRIRSKHFEAFPEEVYKVASKAAARIKDPHPRCDALSEELIE
jgi:hypothetical protein